MHAGFAGISAGFQGDRSSSGRSTKPIMETYQLRGNGIWAVKTTRLSKPPVRQGFIITGIDAAKLD
jgi:hypothetical protein